MTELLRHFASSPLTFGTLAMEDPATPSQLSARSTLTASSDLRFGVVLCPGLILLLPGHCCVNGSDSGVTVLCDRYLVAVSTGAAVAVMCAALIVVTLLASWVITGNSVRAEPPEANTAGRAARRITGPPRDPIRTAVVVRPKAVTYYQTALRTSRPYCAVYCVCRSDLKDVSAHGENT